MIATTALAAALAALFIERQFGVPFYDPTKGGSPVLWQHMFWFYSHPAVYIMILPAFGIISEVLPTFARKPIFGYKMIAFSSMAIALLGFMVWAHHMFTSGLAPWLQLPFMIITMLIAIPTGIKIFSWVATLWGGKIQSTRPRCSSRSDSSHVHARRHHRRLPRGGSVRPARARHLLRRRALPLRARRRLHVRHLRRPLLLVAEDDRAACSTRSSATGTSG